MPPQYVLKLCTTHLVQRQHKIIRLNCILHKWPLMFHILKNHGYENLSPIPQAEWPRHGKLLRLLDWSVLGLMLCYHNFYPGIIGTASSLVIVVAARSLLIVYLEKEKRTIDPG